MYRLYCRNLKNYLEINREGSPEEFRLRIAGPLQVMADVELYNRMKIENYPVLREVENLIFEIGRNIDRYSSFKLFSWELWAYGFDACESNGFEHEVVEEQLKLVDLLLGCQYWCAA